MIDRYGKGESAGYPTLCKGRFEVEGSVYHAIEEPVSLNTLDLLPELKELGISAVKIEGRQRSPAYIADVARTWRQALDRLGAGAGDFRVDPAWNSTLAGLSEGGLTTIGAYHRKWK